jgi:hypothetical protein
MRQREVQHAAHKMQHAAHTMQHAAHTMQHAARCATAAWLLKTSVSVLKGVPEGALMRYSRGTQGVLKGYSRGTQGVLKGYSRGTHGVLKGYSREFPREHSCGTYAVTWFFETSVCQGVLKGYSRGTQGVLTGYSRGTHAVRADLVLRDLRVEEVVDERADVDLRQDRVAPAQRCNMQHV